MTINDLIVQLKRFPQDKQIQMRDCTGDWTTFIEADELEEFVYVQGEIAPKRQIPEYHIDGQLINGVWENIENPGTIGWIAGLSYHRHFVAMCSDPNSKYKRMQLTRDSLDGSDEPFVCVFQDRTPI